MLIMKGNKTKNLIFLPVLLALRLEFDLSDWRSCQIEVSLLSSQVPQGATHRFFFQIVENFV